MKPQQIESAGPISPEGFFYLTGRKRGAEQAEQLRKSGIRFSLKHDGSPSLTWEAYNMQLCTINDAPKTSGPKLGFLNGRKA